MFPRPPRRATMGPLLLAAAALVLPLAALGVGDAAVPDHFVVPSLHEGERFVYGAAVTSTFSGIDATTDEHVRIEVGTVQTIASEHTGPVVVVPVTMRRLPAPWDVDTSAHIAESGERAAARFTTSETDHLALADGRSVRYLHEMVDEQWYRDGPDAGHTTLRVTADHTDGSRGPAARELDDWLGRTFRVDVGEAISSAAVPVLIQHARIGDVEVFGYTSETPPQTISAPLAGCALERPAVAYEEPVMDAWPHDVTVGVATEVWLAQDAAFPVFASCVATYRDAGETIGTVTFRIWLVQHDRGGEVVPLRLHPSGHAAVRGPMQPRPVLVPGLPLTGDGPIPISTEEAFDALASSDDPLLVSFRDDGAFPFAVKSAFFSPSGLACGEVEGVDAPCPDFASLPTAPTQPTWMFVLANTRGEHVVAAVARTTVAGIAVRDEVYVAEASSRDVPERLDADGLPKDLAPLGPMVEDALRRAGLSYGAWAQRDGVWFAVTFEAGHAHGGGPYGSQFTFVRDILETNDGTVTSRSESFSVHRATDGLYQGVVALENAQDAAAPLPEALMQQAEANIGPVPLSEKPTLALVTLGSVALLVAAAAWRFGRPLAGFVAALYAKVRREEALDSENRRSILGLIESDPGVTTQEIAHRLSLGWGTACYHLAVLEQHALVRSHAAARYRGWFVPGAVAPGDETVVATLRSPVTRRVYDRIVANPGTNQKDLVDTFGVDRAAVIFQLKRLIAVGLVHAERDGRSVRYRPARSAPVGPAPVDF